MKGTVAIDVLSGVIGKGLAGGLWIVLTPYFIGLLGVESFGLIGFYALLVACCMFLDQAISPIVTYRFSQAKAVSAEVSHMWGMFRVNEMLAISMGIGLASMIYLSAPWASSQILRSNTMSNDDLLVVMQLMSLMLCLQWPSFMYYSALAGLGDQAMMNILRGAFSFLQWGGGLLVLLLIDTTLQTLFIWYIICLAIQTFLLRRRIVKKICAPRFSMNWLSELRNNWSKYSFGTLIIGFTGTVLTQADKLLVSHVTTLGEFTAYSLAFSLTSTISVFVAQPIMSAIFPYFIRLAVNGGEEAMVTQYRRWTQYIVVIVVPPVCALTFYSHEIVSAWLGVNGVGLEKVAVYIPWVAIGTLLNLLMVLPFNLQLANGWTSLSTYKNLIIVPFFLVVLWWGIPKFGAIVGAIAWLCVNALYYFVEVPLMHRRLLRGVLWKWWLCDTALPCLFGLSFFWIVHHFFYTNTIMSAIYLCVLSCILVGLFLVVLLPECRRAFRHQCKVTFG